MTYIFISLVFKSGLKIADLIGSVQKVALSMKMFQKRQMIVKLSRIMCLIVAYSAPSELLYHFDWFLIHWSPEVRRHPGTHHFDQCILEEKIMSMTQTNFDNMNNQQQLEGYILEGMINLMMLTNLDYQDCQQYSRIRKHSIMLTSSFTKKLGNQFSM